MQAQHSSKAFFSGEGDVSQRKVKSDIYSEKLCRTCAGIPLEKLVSRSGFEYPLIRWSVQESAHAGDCEFCKIICEALGDDHGSEELDRRPIIIRLSNGNSGHGGLCIDPPLLRVLEIGLSKDCTCQVLNRYGRKHDSNYTGSCDAIKLSVDVYTHKGKKYKL